MIVEEDELEGGDAAADIADQTLQSILTNIQTNNNSGNPDTNGFKVCKSSFITILVTMTLTNIQTNNNSGNSDANGFKVSKCSVYLYFGNHDFHK